MTVDMHCHLDLYPKPFEVAKESSKQGIYTLSVTTTPSAWPGTRKLEVGNTRVRTALGLHPQVAHERFGELPLFDRYLPEAKYVGEIGLDGGRNFKKHWEVQLRVFRHILHSVNQSGGRIMSIHSLASAASVLEELQNIDGIPILHWFSGTKSELKKAIEHDCWFSVGPSMLRSSKGKEIASLIPRNRLLTETDGPFARINEQPLFPWDANVATNEIATLWQVDSQEAAGTIGDNLRNLVYPLSSKQSTEAKKS